MALTTQDGSAPVVDAPIIIGANQPPLVGPFIGPSINVTYRARAAAVVLHDNIPVTDTGSAALVGATVKIGSGFHAGDALHFADQSGIVGTYDATSHVLTLTGAATVAQYESALQSVTFDNRIDDNSGDGSPRIIQWQVNDGSDLSNIYQTFVNKPVMDDVPLHPIIGSPGEGPLIPIKNDEPGLLKLPNDGFLSGSPLALHGGHFDAGPGAGRVVRDGTGAFRIDDINDNHVITHNLGAVGIEWQFLGAGDFNGDGTSDLLSWPTTHRPLVSPSISNNQVAGAASLGAIGSEFNFRGIGDFNHDGSSDLLWQRAGDGMVVIDNVQHNQIVGTSALGAIGADWTFLGTADFNSDGTSDLLWQHAGDGMVLIHDVQNNHVSDASFVGAIGSDWHFVGTGDFNGDHTGDLLFQRDDGTLRIYSIVNNQVVASPVLEKLAGDTHVVGIADYTGDGT